MKKVLSYLSLLIVCSGAYASNNSAQRDKKDWRNNIYIACEKNMQKSSELNMIKKYFIQDVCTCYADKVVDNVDWNKYATMSDYAAFIYVLQTVQDNEDKVRTGCVAKLSVDLNQFIDHPQQGKAKCGILSWEKIYESVSNFSRFRIRWDSKTYTSIIKRAENCFDSDKELYKTIKKDRAIDIITGTSVLLGLIIMIICSRKTKAKK